MNHKERARKFRKDFLIPFLIAMGIMLMFILTAKNISMEEVTFLMVVVFALYIAGYIHGWNQGREDMRQVLDFMKPGLRWDVMDAQNQMHEEADREYYNGE